MKKIHFLILVSTIVMSCDSQKSIIKNGQTYENFRGFEPTDATEYNAKVNIVVKDEFVEKEIKLLSPQEVLSFLNNETVLVSIGQIDFDGKISYIPVTLSAKGSSYKITMDYMKFATLGQVDKDGKFLGYKRVGVGLRLISQITTFESGINIGDISSIGIAAKAGKLNGTLMIEVIGIKSKEVTTLLPLPSEINQSTIQSAMQALATIKSKIYDPETVLYPQVMAVKEEKENTIDKNAGLTLETNPSIKTDSAIAIFTDSKEIDNKVKLQFENNPATSLSKVDAANKLVTEAFEFLFSKDVEQTIDKFNQCERVYPQYHSVFEINQLLKSNKESLKDKTSPKWASVASTLLERYSWKLSTEIKNQLKIMSGK
ncbi:hypothetical protein [Flavobacterium sp. 25HG05S-40]|uniref:hypothetical protein n=1 Tax=Flavobacterium sp. 25HG05S-40 TaxID=3458682 RepID=UPI0040449C2E